MDKWKFSGILVGVLLSVLMFGKYVVTFGEENKIPVTTSHEKYYLNDDLMDGFVEVKGNNIYHYDKYKIPKKGWISDKNNVKRYFSNGLIVDGWHNIDGYQYYFKKDGVCVTGCQSIDGEDYYFDNRGRLQYGERIFGQDVYMYDLVDGHLLKDTWYKHDGLVQYVDLDGRLIVSSFYDLNGDTYYFDEDGNKCVSDWINLSNNRYYVDEDGHLVTGEQFIDDGVYYFDEHGRLFVNKEVLTSTGERVYLADDGRSVKNQWHEDTYYNEDGYAVSVDEVPVLELDAKGFFNGPLGDMGRLYVPSVGVDVALYWVGPYDGNAQAICDCQDAAVWMGPEWDDYIGWGDVIADHWNQGFDAIKSCQVGNKAYIVTADKIRVYECVGIDYDGHNLEYTCVDSQGRSLWQISDIVMYTCNENWQHITCVFWTQII